MTDAIPNGTDPSLPTSKLYSTLPILHSTLVSIKYKEETIPAVCMSTQSIKNDLFFPIRTTDKKSITARKQKASVSATAAHHFN